MRSAKPRFCAQNQTWYVCQRRKQVQVAKGNRSHRVAQQVSFRLMAIEESVSALTVEFQPASRLQPIASVLDLFLEWVQQNLKRYD